MTGLSRAVGIFFAAYLFCIGGLFRTFRVPSMTTRRTGPTLSGLWLSLLMRWSGSLPPLKPRKLSWVVETFSMYLFLVPVEESTTTPSLL
ncbi:hypothetical protein MtrunA17_Chr3g0098991 [Medicago truncatula]|uniref:Transmembrane protein n=1 Tax=Medicago truncatula TaxID=3880 RepID=A0A396IRH9_MEDTR|nr:hypothetical protein MtrunA17_Chr3g0098991 [Medicago truncatula]